MKYDRSESLSRDLSAAKELRPEPLRKLRVDQLRETLVEILSLYDQCCSTYSVSKINAAATLVHMCEAEICHRGDEGVALVRRLVNDPDPRVAHSAAYMALWFDEETAVKRLKELMESSEIAVEVTMTLAEWMTGALRNPLKQSPPKERTYKASQKELYALLWPRTEPEERALPDAARKSEGPEEGPIGPLENPVHFRGSLRSEGHTHVERFSAGDQNRSMRIEAFIAQAKGMNFRDLDLLRQLARPAIQLTPQVVPAESLPRGNRLGGLPLLPASVAWPRKDGESLAFIAQIDLAAMPGVVTEIGLPRDGILLFF